MKTQAGKISALGMTLLSALTIACGAETNLVQIPALPALPPSGTPPPESSASPAPGAVPVAQPATGDANAQPNDKGNLSSGCSKPAQPAKKIMNVAYQNMSGVEPNRHALDIYMPAVGNPCKGVPVVIWVHGGAWMLGDKSNVDSKATFVNSLGYALVSINYRLSPNLRFDTTLNPSRIKFPDHPNDVGAAVAWIFSNINEFMRTTTGQPRLIYRNAFGDDPAVWTSASPINFIQEYGMAIQLAKRGDLERQEQLESFKRALEDKKNAVSVINTQSLSHEEVNRLIGAPGDQIMTPFVSTFLSQSCFPK